MGNQSVSERVWNNGETSGTYTHRLLRTPTTHKHRGGLAKIKAKTKIQRYKEKDTGWDWLT